MPEYLYLFDVRAVNGKKSGESCVHRVIDGKTFEQKTARDMETDSEESGKGITTVSS